MPRVLIVDDDPDHCEVIGRLLQKNGYSTRLAANGWEALIALDTESIDVVLLDLMMPGMDGLTFLNILRNDQRRKHLPVLVISAASPDQLGQDMDPDAFQKYFRKAEFKLADLVSAVHSEVARADAGGFSGN